MSKTTLILRIVGTVSHLCWNQMPSNLHFRFSSSCIGHLNKTQMEMAVMLTFPVFENLDWKENNVESFKDFGQPTAKWQSFKFFWNCTEILFYLQIISNIMNHKHIFN